MGRRDPTEPSLALDDMVRTSTSHSSCQSRHKRRPEERRCLLALMTATRDDSPEEARITPLDRSIKRTMFLGEMRFCPPPTTTIYIPPILPKPT